MPSWKANLALRFTVLGAAWVIVGCNEPTRPDSSSLTVQISPSTVVLSVGGTARLSPVTTDDKGAVRPSSSVRFRSFDHAVATIAADGLVTALGEGQTQVVATVGESSDTATVIVSSGGGDGTQVQISPQALSSVATVFTTFADETPVGAGSVQTVASATTPTPLFGLDANGALRAAGVMLPGVEDSKVLSARSTALFLLWMSPGIGTPDAATAQPRMATLSTLPCARAVETLLSERMGSLALSTIVAQADVRQSVRSCVEEGLGAIAALEGGRLVGANAFGETLLRRRDYADRDVVELVNGRFRRLDVYRRPVGSESSPVRAMELAPGATALSWGTWLRAGTPQVRELTINAEGAAAAYEYWIVGPAIQAGDPDPFGFPAGQLWWYTVADYLAEPFIRTFVPLGEVAELAFATVSGTKLVDAVARGSEEDILSEAINLAVGIAGMSLTLGGYSLAAKALAAASLALSSANAVAFLWELQELQRVERVVLDGPTAGFTGISASRNTIAPGDHLQLGAVVRDRFGLLIQGSPASWSSSNPAVFTVGAGGLVHGLTPGVAEARLVAGGREASTTLTVVGGSSGSVVFDEDFSGSLSRWITAGGNGNWQTTNGELFGNYNISCGSTTCPQAQLLLRPEHQPQGTRWRAEMTVSYVRNQYSIAYDIRSAGGVFSLWVSESEKHAVGGGIWRNLAELPTVTTELEWSHQRYPWSYVGSGTPTVQQWSPFEWNTLALERDGDEYRLSFNGEHLYTFSWQFSSAPRLGISLYGRGRYGSFRVITFP